MSGSRKNMKRKPLSDRFWAKVNKTETCWLWTGSIIHGGYGCIGLGGAADGNARAHRVSYELHYGAFDQTLDVLHRCDTPACVRPDHLFLGTARDNAIDMFRKGRGTKLKGSAASQAKLTEQQVYEIRGKHIPWKYSIPRLAKEYGVAPVTIWNVLHGVWWEHVPFPPVLKYRRRPIPLHYVALQSKRIVRN